MNPSIPIYCFKDSVNSFNKQIKIENELIIIDELFELEFQLLIKKFIWLSKNQDLLLIKLMMI